MKHDITSFGTYKKVKLHFAADENRELLHLLTHKNVSYRQAKIKGNSIVYYNLGVEIMPRETFYKKCADGYMLRTMNRHVAVFSVNSDIDPDGTRFLRTGRRTAIAVGATFQWLECQGITYKDFPETADFKQIEILRTDIDLSRDAFTITANVPRNFAFTESTIDYTNYLTNSLNPILTALADLKAKVEINVYANAVGRSSILNSILLLFSNLRLLRTNKEDTREVRQHLINALLDGDSYKIDPENPNRLILSENQTVNQNEQLDTPMVGGLYRVDGAVFRDKIDFETAMQCKDLYRPTTYEELIQNQKDANRSEYLMYHCSLSERLQSITPEEMDRKDSPHIGCHLAMTEEEQEVYFEADSNGDKDTMSRIELQARDRWSSFRQSI